MTKSIFLFFYLISSIAVAQQHPLEVEPSALLEKGYGQLDAGISSFRDQTYPLSGLTGDLLKLGQIRFAFSLSDFVELQMDGTLLNLLNISKRDSAFNSSIVNQSNLTGDIGDFRVWTKFLIFNEYRSGIGIAVRFGIQLPNASNESGLGIDEMNFYSSILFQKHIGGLLTINTGLGILSDPTSLGQQHDVFTYGIGYTLPVATQTYVILQSAGRNGHTGPGVHHLVNGKVGIEQFVGSFSVKALGVVNLGPYDHAKGIELSVSYLFQIMEIK